MADLLADEHFPVTIVYALRRLGHDVLTVREANVNKEGDGWTDEQVLQYAAEHKRAVITKNVNDFRALHEERPWHGGIVACSFSDKAEAKAIARKLDNALSEAGDRLKGQWIRFRENYS